jgi:hypothetical protein
MDGMEGQTMRVYDRNWTREDARRRAALPEQRIESDIERWARTQTCTRSAARQSSASPLLVGLAVVAATPVLIVVCLFLSSAVSISLSHQTTTL